MINIVGQFMSCSGYALHTRQLAMALSKLTDVRVTTMLYPGYERECSDREFEILNKKPELNETNLIIDLPFTWRQHIKGDNNIGFLVWEGDKIPQSFIPELLNPRIKQIWVPSHHTKQAIINTLEELPLLGKIEKFKEINDKIRIVPHGVDLSLFYPKKKPDIFTFVCNKGWRNMWDRGGVQYAVQAYLKEFKKGEALLKIKINPAYGIENVNNLLNKLHANSPLAPDIMIDTSYLPYNKIHEIYQGHVLISPVRAEAYGLQMIEAMACGLPVLATGYGGHLDFIKDQYNGLLIDYDLKPVKNEVFYEEVSWAIPKIDDLRKKMRWAYEHQNELENIGKNALQTARENTWDISASKALKYMQEL